MAEAGSRCPRCGGDFHCGFGDAAPCACATVPLDESVRAELRLRYTGCLCLACLRAIAASKTTPETGE